MTTPPPRFPPTHDSFDSWTEISSDSDIIELEIKELLDAAAEELVQDENNAKIRASLNEIKHDAELARHEIKRLRKNENRRKYYHREKAQNVAICALIAIGNNENIDNNNNKIRIALSIEEEAKLDKQRRNAMASRRWRERHPEKVIESRNKYNLRRQEKRASLREQNKTLNTKPKTTKNRRGK